MAKQTVDDEDSLRRRARRRLIGAVALTTAVVVIVPMVLDSEPKPVQQNIELRIPDKDKAAEFAPKIDVPYTSAVVAASAPVMASAPAPAPVTVSAPVPVKPAAALSVAPPVALPAAPHAAPAAALAPSAKPAAADKPAATEPAKHDAPAAHEKPAPASGFVVQIGAFSSADKAHVWQKNLSGQGFKAYTEKAGDKTRVRVGPYPTREAANKVRHKLEAKGLHVNVVDLGA